MKLTQIDLNLFVVFNTIYAERNLTRAAEQLSVTQPAVSNALGRLRRRLEDPLFVHTSEGMQPTAFAESIAHRVADALHGLHIAAQPPAQFSPANSRRRFIVSTLDLYGQAILPGLSRQLLAQAPGTTLESVRLPRADLPRAMERGQVDIAIDIPLADAANLVGHTLAYDPYVCALRPGHPFARQAPGLDDYLALRHLHVSGRRQGEGAVDIALRRIGRKRDVAIRVPSFAGVSEIIGKTDLALTLTAGWAAGLPLTVQPLPLDVKPLELRLYRHIRSDGDAAVLWLFDLIRTLPGLPPAQPADFPEQREI